jgi:hypothetical protein
MPNHASPCQTMPRHAKMGNATFCPQTKYTTTKKRFASIFKNICGVLLKIPHEGNIQPLPTTKRANHGVNNPKSHKVSEGKSGLSNSSRRSSKVWS